MKKKKNEFLYLGIDWFFFFFVQKKQDIVFLYMSQMWQCHIITLKFDVGHNV